MRSPQPLNANPIYKKAHIPLHHPERSEGSSDGLYILAGFFPTLRMTDMRFVIASASEAI